MLTKCAVRADESAKALVVDAKDKLGRLDKIELMLQGRVDGLEQVHRISVGEAAPGQDPLWGPVTDMRPEARIRNWARATHAVNQAVDKELAVVAELSRWVGSVKAAFEAAVPGAGNISNFMTTVAATIAERHTSFEVSLKTKNAVNVTFAAQDVALASASLTPIAEKADELLGETGSTFIEQMGAAPRSVDALGRVHAVVTEGLASVGTLARELVEELGGAIDE